MKTFKDKQKVRHPKYGEGIFNLHHLTNKYSIDFGDIQTLWKDVNDDFYNQLEAVEDLPEVGEYAYFWDNDWAEGTYAYARFEGLNTDAKSSYKYLDHEETEYQNISKTPPRP